MAYTPQNMDELSSTNRGIIRQFSYVSDTDALADVTTTPGYFDESRFSKVTGWSGSWIFAKLADGHHVLVVEADGRTIKKF